MSLQNATGALTTIFGLGITLAAFGLTLEFVDRSFNRYSPQPQRKRKQSGYKNLLSYGMPQSKGYGLPQSKGRKRSTGTYNDFFAGLDY